MSTEYERAIKRKKAFLAGLVDLFLRYDVEIDFWNGEQHGDVEFSEADAEGFVLDLCDLREAVNQQREERRIKPEGNE